MTARRSLRAALASFAFVAVILLSALAFADGPAPVVPTVGNPGATWSAVAMTALVAAVSNPQTWGVLAAIVYFVLAHFRAADAAKAKALFGTVFNLVEDAKATGALPTGANKTVAAVEKLKELSDKPVTDAMLDAAKTEWAALHGAQSAAAVTALTSADVKAGSAA